VRPGEYGRDVAPDAIGKPYCPFAPTFAAGHNAQSIFGYVAVVALSSCYIAVYQHLGSLSPSLVECSMPCVLMILCLDLWLPNSSSVYGIGYFSETLMARVPQVIGPRKMVTSGETSYLSCGPQKESGR